MKNLKTYLKVISNNKDSSRTIAKKLNISKSTVNNWRSKYNAILNTSKKEKPKKPNILLLDIETAPDVSCNFNRRDVNISNDSVVRQGGWLISIAWKWLGDSETFGLSVNSQSAKESDDYHLITNISNLINKADIIVGHNIKKFDLPVIKSRILSSNNPSLKRIKVYDTLSALREMKFKSNKLDDISKNLFGTSKLKHEGINLWIDCINGDTDALSKMLEYNKQDIALLEKLYLALRGHSSQGINLQLFSDASTDYCPHCLESIPKPTGEYIYVGQSKYEELYCDVCSGTSRSKKPVNTKKNALVF